MKNLCKLYSDVSATQDSHSFRQFFHGEKVIATHAEFRSFKVSCIRFTTAGYQDVIGLEDLVGSLHFNFVRLDE